MKGRSKMRAAPLRWSHGPIPKSLSKPYKEFERREGGPERLREVLKHADGSPDDRKVADSIFALCYTLPPFYSLARICLIQGFSVARLSEVVERAKVRMVAGAKS
jgi:hypothetical protein